MLNKDFVKWVIIAFLIAPRCIFMLCIKSSKTLPLNYFKLVDICAGRDACARNCFADGELAELEGSNAESG